MCANSIRNGESGEARPMEKWLRKTQKIITLLLLLDLLAWAGLHLLPGASLLPRDGGENPQIFDSAVTVRADSGGLFGNICVETEGRVSAAKALLLVNGLSAGDFSQGLLTVRVYPGDLLALDGSAYQRRMRFTITTLSSGIDSAYLPDTVVTDGGVTDWGVIVFK